MVTALYVLCVFSLIFVLCDAFVTVVSTRGSGPPRALWTARLWKARLVFHNRRPIHKILAFSGLVMKAWQQYQPKRQELLSLCARDGWYRRV